MYFMKRYPYRTVRLPPPQPRILKRKYIVKLNEFPQTTSYIHKKTHE